MIKAHFDTFAGYNAWANARLYEATGKLAEADYRRDGGAFFGSLHATLNHLLGTDRVWHSRCFGVDAVQGPVPTRLDCILFEDFAQLRAARVQEDAAILKNVRALPEEAYSGLIRYRRVSTPIEHTQARAEAMAHWFNHQTHHRGQAHALLTQIAGRDAAPEMDLLFYTRAVAAGEAV
jgi:uncharacterized damage-inducible protein DinB